MPHAIARIAKLKKTNIAAAAQHSRRQRETPNANPDKSNLCLIDAAADLNLEDLVQHRIGDQAIRKNAVLCLELLLSGGPVSLFATGLLAAAMMKFVVVIVVIVVIVVTSDDAERSKKQAKKQATTK